MKLETLISKLKEKGFCYPVSLRWNSDDIDARLRAIGQGHQIKMISQEDKLMLLDGFFDSLEDEICEYINLQLENYLEQLETFRPSQEPF